MNKVGKNFRSSIKKFEKHTLVSDITTNHEVAMEQFKCIFEDFKLNE